MINNLCIIYYTKERIIEVKKPLLFSLDKQQKCKHDKQDKVQEAFKYIGFTIVKVDNTY